MTTIGAIGHRSPGMGPLRESLNEQWARQADAADEETSAAAVLNRFVQSSDEMAASLRSQFRRRGDMGDKLEGLADRFERVLEEDALPKAMQIFSVARQPGVSIDWLLQQARGLFPDDSDLVLVLRELLRRSEWQALIADLPGYDIADAGEVVALRRAFPWYAFRTPKRQPAPCA